MDKTNEQTQAGYVLVPVEPTEEMMNAGYDATRKSDGMPQFMSDGFCLGHTDKIYRAMLAAAPQAQPVREPMSPEQIEALPVWQHFVGLSPKHHQWFVRAIERHHGITKE